MEHTTTTTRIRTTRTLTRAPMSGAAKAAIVLGVAVVVVGGGIAIAAAASGPAKPASGMPAGPYAAVAASASSPVALDPSQVYLFSITPALAQSLGGETSLAQVIADAQQVGIKVLASWDVGTVPPAWPASDSAPGEYRLVLQFPAGATWSTQNGTLFTTGGVAPPQPSPNPAPPAPAGPTTWVVTPANTGGTINAQVGDTLQIDLAGVPSVGAASYSWQYQTTFGPTWQYVGRTQLASAVYGTMTVDTWTAVGGGAGSTGGSADNIALVFAPVDANGNPTGGQPTATFTLTVNQKWPAGVGALADVGRGNSAGNGGQGFRMLDAIEPMTGHDADLHEPFQHGRH
jgi:hypothetical protein